MEFLVEVDVSLPLDMSDARRGELREAETARGVALAQQGLLRAIWRVPGRLANCGIWSASDATELHDALVSLPFWPYMDVKVSPLAEHPLGASCLGIPGGRGRDGGAEH
jgi:muconolactone D-isomerase